MKNMANRVEQRTNSGTQIWTRDFILILLASLIGNIAVNMHSATLSLFVLHLGGDKSSIGLVSGIVSLSALIIRPLSGMLLDSWSKRIVLAAGFFIIAITSLSYTLITSIAILLVLRLVLGVGLSAYGSAVGTIITDLSPRQALGKTFGYNALVATAATAFGSYLGIYLVRTFDYRMFYLVVFAIGVVALLVAAMINYEKDRHGGRARRFHGNKGQRGKVFSLSSMIEKTAIPYSLANLFVFFAIPGVVSFMPAFAASKGINGIESFFIVYSLAFVVGQLVSNLLARSLKTTSLIVGGMLLMASSFAVFSVASNLEIIFLGAILYGMGTSTVFPGMNSLAVTECIPERRGAANATYLISIDLGFLLGSFAWGILAQEIGYNATYFVACLFILLALLVFMNHVRSNHKQHNVNTKFD